MKASVIAYVKSTAYNARTTALLPIIAKLEHREYKW
jgi:hypothetical protein